jgi:hypothetical protein
MRLPSRGDGYREGGSSMDLKTEIPEVAKRLLERLGRDMAAERAIRSKRAYVAVSVPVIHSSV